MEHLVIDLKEKLITRKKNENDALLKLDKEADRERILISAGKIFELEFLINSINEMLVYSEKSKKIEK
ncbi:MAG: hypothetical protein A2W90_12955 [Bacteroidetes bacterium GWF2_42_66]|nr:MAG: hypothetical protein A2W92_19535 [Bacteroidetes bacterium GWA2_42_15]OFY00131.1 MAG: hypothetical protein A2W89_17945 [Bacteroidetes bacterium GWE2_42_39]OFY40273.1 MAG: hypothetical protein A2W90_12955 [Bacteroidetes bacterium GWF2_42_66]HBL73748.1 hypothetical protein [Prolixibacteraceae bacterium]HCR91211.1 hypothetical protein [Prolixibacteraceae bacterium]